MGPDRVRVTLFQQMLALWGDQVNKKNVQENNEPYVVALVFLENKKPKQNFKILGLLVTLHQRPTSYGLIFIPRAIKKRPTQHTKRIIDRKKEKQFGINAFLHFMFSPISRVLSRVGKCDFNKGNILVYCNVIRSLVMISKNIHSATHRERRHRVPEVIYFGIPTVALGAKS